MVAALVLIHMGTSDHFCRKKIPGPGMLAASPQGLVLASPCPPYGFYSSLSGITSVEGWLEGHPRALLTSLALICALRS